MRLIWSGAVLPPAAMVTVTTVGAPLTFVAYQISPLAFRPAVDTVIAFAQVLAGLPLSVIDAIVGKPTESWSTTIEDRTRKLPLAGAAMVMVNLDALIR